MEHERAIHLCVMLHWMSRIYLAHDGILDDCESRGDVPGDRRMLPDRNPTAGLAIDQHSQLHQARGHMGILRDLWDRLLHHGHPDLHRAPEVL